MAIVSKQTHQTVELFDVPDDQLKACKVESVSTNQGPYNKDLMELYKMEYERCAQRYDDLYKAAWTNFSYIALIAGAILTFGSSRFMPELSIVLATIPLLFWWLASFEPLNRYGDQVENRLVVIESLINEIYGLNSKELDKLCSDQKERREQQRGLRHFQLFRQMEFKLKHPVKFAFGSLTWLPIILLSLWGVGLLALSALWVVILLILLLVFLLIWFISGTSGRFMRPNHEQASRNPKYLQLLRVRFVVRVFAGVLLTAAICSALSAYNQRAAGYITRSSTKTDSPAGLIINLEK